MYKIYNIHTEEMLSLANPLLNGCQVAIAPARTTSPPHPAAK